MLNLDPHKSQVSISEIKQIHQSVENFTKEKKSIFTLNDGIKLLKSNKNISIDDIIKIPNAKISNIAKKYDDKIINKNNTNILNINSIKGKSIFNNSILDNVLGTISINADQSLKVNYDNKLKSNLDNKTNIGNDNTSYNTIKEKPKNILISQTNIDKSKTNSNFNKSILNSNLISNHMNNDLENIDESINDFYRNKNNQNLTKNKFCKYIDKRNDILNKKISSAEEPHRPLPLITIDFNFNKRGDYANNLRLFKEINKNNERVIKNKNFISNIIEDDVASTSNYYNSSTNKNTSEFKNIINNSTLNSSKNNSIVDTSMSNNYSSKVFLHNKELKFELFRHNKLHGMIKEVKAKHRTFYDRYIPNIKNNESMQGNANRTVAIEASTQTKYNISSVLDEKNSKISDKDDKFNNTSIYNNLSNNPVNRNFKDLTEEGDDSSKNNQLDENIKKKNITILEDKDEIHRNNSKTNIHFNKRNFLANENNSNPNLNTINDDMVNSCSDKNEFNFKSGNSKNTLENRFYQTKNNNIAKKSFYKLNNNNNSNSLYYQTNKFNNVFDLINKSRFFCPANISSERTYNNMDFMDNNIVRLNSPKFQKYDLKSIDKNNDVNEFNSEIFQNSKILRENFINSNKIINKSQTSYKGESLNCRKVFNIKYSKNVKM